MENGWLLNCPVCDKSRSFSSKYSMQNAKNKKTKCASCRTTANNKQRIGTNVKEKNGSWRGYQGVPGKVLSRLRNGAKRRKLHFDITLEDIFNVYKKQGFMCAFSGIPVSFDKDASVDRIDSDLGYTTDNIQVVHKDLNMMKRNINNELFIQWCILVAKNFKDNK